MSSVVNNQDISYPCLVEEIDKELIYTVRNGFFIVNNLFGTQEELAIPVSPDATLFFDPDGNHYTINTDGFIAQYNFVTKELDQLDGQVATWVNVLSRLADGTFIWSRPQDFPSTQDFSMANSSLDGTLIAENTNGNIAGGVLGTGIKFITSLSKEGDITVITALYYLDANNLDSIWFAGEGTYNVDGLLIDMNDDTFRDEQSGGTIDGDSIYSLHQNDILVRDSLTYEIKKVIELSDPSVQLASGSISFFTPDATGSFTANLLSIKSTNTFSRTIIDGQGSSSSIIEVGDKRLEMEVNAETSVNIDEFFNVDDQNVLVTRNRIVNGVTTEVSEAYITAGVSTEDTSTYIVSLKTPDKE